MSTFTSYSSGTSYHVSLFPLYVYDIEFLDDAGNPYEVAKIRLCSSIVTGYQFFDIGTGFCGGPDVALAVLEDLQHPTEVATFVKDIPAGETVRFRMPVDLVQAQG